MNHPLIVRSQSTRRLALAALAVVATTSAMAPAAAAPAHAGGHGRSGSHGSHAHSGRPTARPFTARGIVVGKDARSLTMLAADARSGRTVSRGVQVTVAVPTGRKGSAKKLARSLAAARPGDRVVVNGTQSGTAVTARQFATAPAAFHLYLGTVTGLSGSRLTVTKNAVPSDDPQEVPRGTLTVEAGSAAINTDGAASELSTLAVGTSVAVLGSEWRDTVLATAIWDFAAAPTVVAGRVASVSGSTVTLADEDGDDASDPAEDPGDNPGDDPVAAPTTVDLGSAPVVVDGVSGAAPATLTAGSRLVVLQSADGTSLLAVAFTRSCTSRHHGDGGAGAAGDDEHDGD